MNFERGKETKEAIGIGVQEILIQRISEHFRKYVSRETSFTMENKESKTICVWVVRRGSYSYAKLIKIQPGSINLEPTEYPGYVVEYDSGGIDYGNCSIEEFTEEPKQKSE